MTTLVGHIILKQGHLGAGDSVDVQNNIRKKTKNEIGKRNQSAVTDLVEKFDKPSALAEKLTPENVAVLENNVRIRKGKEKIITDKKTTKADDAVKEIADIQKQLDSPNLSVDEKLLAISKCKKTLQNYKEYCEKEEKSELKKPTSFVSVMCGEFDKVITDFDKVTDGLHGAKLAASSLLTSANKQITESQQGQGDNICPQTLEALRKLQQRKEMATQKVYLDKTVLALEGELSRKAQDRLGEIQNPTEENKSAIYLEYFGGAPPKKKGESDSFFINGADGKPEYIFKTVQGENRAGLEWPENGGAARELMASGLNDVFKKECKMDFKVPETTYARIQDPTFAQGSKSKETSRNGALQKAVKFNQGDPTDCQSLFPNPDGKPETKAKIKKLKDAINPKDAQMVAVWDLFTLNTDRKPDNLLVQNPGDQPGQTNLVPIDSGNLLPNKAAFKKHAAKMTVPDGKWNADAIDKDQNFLLQLPLATQPLSDEVVAAIANIDPAKIVKGMKASHEAVAKQAPHLKNAIEEESFELVGKSIQFLKEAVKQKPPLSLFEITQIYGTGPFDNIVDAPVDQTDTAIQQVFQDWKAFKDAGGDQGVMQQLKLNYDQVCKLTYPQKVKILKNKMTSADWDKDQFKELQKELADLDNFLDDGPEKDTIDLNKGFSNDDYTYLKELAEYKKMGGDAALKNLLKDNQVTLKLELAKKVGGVYTASKRSALEDATTFQSLGGYPALIKAVGQDEYNAKLKNLTIGKQLTALIKAQSS